MSRHSQFDEKIKQVLVIQRKKLLVAINKHTGETDINPEDEQLVKTVLQKINASNFINFTGLKDPEWQDFEACELVKTKLQEHSVFKLSKYLNCAINVCYTFSTKNDTEDITPNMMYLLIHAREFGDPTKTIFKTETSVDLIDNVGFDNRNIFDECLTNSDIVKHALQLIEELAKEYDDSKYQVLNGYITSFVLLVLRRVIKGTMTISDEDDCLMIAIAAYLHTEDQKTKYNFQKACLKYIEWHDMQLPCLFFKVVEIYGIDEGKLWDLLSAVNYSKINISLINFATAYYNNYQLVQSDTKNLQDWFPYCRRFDNYFNVLSNHANDELCVFLSKLIAKKNDMWLNEPAYNYTTTASVFCMIPDSWDRVVERLFVEINKVKEVK